MSTLAALLALPFLFVSALMLLGSFLIVRLAVMLFPAIAVLGVLPAGRGLVIGIGRTVGAALINSVIFGIGAAVTIRVLGLILDPHSQLPGWLALVLMPLFSFVMWVGLKPFRRLTAMVSPNADPFGDAAGSLGDARPHRRTMGEEGRHRSRCRLRRERGRSRHDQRPRRGRSRPGEAVAGPGPGGGQDPASLPSRPRLPSSPRPPHPHPSSRLLRPRRVHTRTRLRQPVPLVLPGPQTAATSE